MRFPLPTNLTLTKVVVALVLVASFQLLATSSNFCIAGGGRSFGQNQNSKNPSTTAIQLGEKTEYVDLVELNHFIDDQGRQVFRQLVFYDWSDLDKRFQVRSWRLIKNDRQLPRRFWTPKRYECHWHDDGQRRTVLAKQMRETWTQQDPERANRKFLPEDQRVPLFAKD